MQRLAALAVACGAITSAIPAGAVEIKYCSDIQDVQARMSCMQDHISHLEQTLLTLNDQVTQLSRQLDQKMNLSDVYKLQSVTQNKCLGLSTDSQSVAVLTCDHPDSWKLLSGSEQAPKKKAASASASNTPSASGSSATSTAGRPSASSASGAASAKTAPAKSSSKSSAASKAPTAPGAPSTSSSSAPKTAAPSQ